MTCETLWLMTYDYTFLLGKLLTAPSGFSCCVFLTRAPGTCSRNTPYFCHMLPCFFPNWSWQSRLVVCHVRWCLLESRWILSFGWKLGQLGKIHSERLFGNYVLHHGVLKGTCLILTWRWQTLTVAYSTRPYPIFTGQNTSKTLFNGIDAWSRLGMSIFIQSITNINIDSDRYLQGLTWIAGWVSGSAWPNSTLVGCIGQTAIAVLKVASLFANISAVPVLLSILVRQSSWKKKQMRSGVAVWLVISTCDWVRIHDIIISPCTCTLFWSFHSIYIILP